MKFSTFLARAVRSILCLKARFGKWSYSILKAKPCEKSGFSLKMVCSVSPASDHPNSSQSRWPWTFEVGRFFIYVFRICEALNLFDVDVLQKVNA